MAIINCPECGKEVSSEAVNCIHCGYPLQKHSESIKDETKKPIIPIENEIPPKRNGKNLRTRLIIGGAAAVVCIVLIFVFLVLPVLKHNNICMPYGITADMSLSQAAQILEQNGFERTETQVLSTEVDFKPRKLLGAITSSTSVIDYKTAIALVHWFKEPDSGETISSIYERLKKEFVNQYGSPTNGMDDMWYNGKDCYVRIVNLGDSMYVQYYCDFK